MDDIRSFRNAMAENGYEYTPAEAKKVMTAVNNFREDMDRQFIENPQMFDNLRSMTVQDKQRICLEFAENGTEVSPDELDDLVQLILSTQEMDNPEQLP